jgi:hypothetical protein
MGRLGVFTAILIFGAAAPASANTIANFALDGVIFNDGGTASGTFSLDLTTHIINQVSITTTPGGALAGSTYTGDAADTYVFSPTTEVAFNQALSPDLGTILDIHFALSDSTDLSSLPTFALTGGELVYFSLCGGVCNSRGFSAGSIVTQSVSQTPIPATLPLLATALGGIGAVGWRHKRAA